MNAMEFPSIVIDKKLHSKITKRFSQACKRGTKYDDLSRVRMKEIINKVYYDMPELRRIALEMIDNGFIK